MPRLQVRTPQWALDLLQYVRQQDLIDLRIALCALRWLTSAIQDIIREREQRTELDLIEGNVLGALLDTREAPMLSKKPGSHCQNQVIMQ